MVDIISLEKAEGDPFALYPQLEDIWPSPYVELARQYSAEDSHTGQVFLIKNVCDVIGITGVFVDEDEPDDLLFLRWTGVIPKQRRSGATRAALELLISGPIVAMYPARRWLVELVPCNPYGRILVEPFFQKLGFIKRGDPRSYAGMEYQSQEYFLDLFFGAMNK